VSKRGGFFASGDLEKIFSDEKFIDYKIEKEEVCILSGNEPPYISIKLKCNHYIFT
jgi:hypothetical protein